MGTVPWGFVLVLLLLVAPLARLSAAALSCESSPAVLALEQSFNQRRENATFEQSLALQDQAYQELTALDPSDYRPVVNYIWHIRYDKPEQWSALRERVLAEAKAHPDDPAKQMVAAEVLSGKDTPQAFRLMDALVAKRPDYAPAYVELAFGYRALGKYADKGKAATYVEKYYQLCPASRDGAAMYSLKQLGSNELKARVAKNLRARLSSETDPNVLRAYSDVWSLEFATMPVTEHAKERQRVLEDVKRLEQLPVTVTAQWLAFLRDGYKQSGATEAQIQTVENRISKEFPHSQEAEGIYYQNWKDAHPQPAGEASAAEWQAYMRAAIAHYRDLMARFPSEYGFSYSLAEYTEHLDGSSNEDVVREADAYIRLQDLYEGPSSSTRQFVAGLFLDRGIEPARSLTLVREAQRLRNTPMEQINWETFDYNKPKDLEDSARERAIDEARFHVLYLRACRAAGNKSAAEELKATVEIAPPADAKVAPPYWNARAILAELEGHNTDALAFYQKALWMREPPQKKYGVLRDTLLADAHRVWSAEQGSEAAFAIWSQPDNSNKPALAEGRWEKPDKELPAFELTDLQGKTWKLASLEGKKVLINIWATWCGPCQSELPHLEKLYEQTKGRTDIAILTLNFDQDLGMVEPFVKKKGYTFPVLPAYAFLSNKIDVNSIPRNWLIDAAGKWQWEQIGFLSTEPDWEKTMLSRLEGTK